VTTTNSFNVLIAGGGVAGLEAALALRDMADDRVSTTMLAADLEFTYRPMTVREPFGYSTARRYRLDRIADDIGVQLAEDSFKWLDAEQRTVHTGGGEQHRYDALVLALGARLRPAFKHATTINDLTMDEQLHGLIEDIEGGYVRKLAFIIPSPPPWPLPAYELALMTARRAYEMSEEASITIVTPEDAPLAVFGREVSEHVKLILEDHNILTLTSAHCDVRDPGQVTIHPGDRTLHVDRVVALPQLFGPDTPGVPKPAHEGFINVDAYCQVAGLDRVYAAGDATDFGVKMGGIAAQQADTAAEAIAGLAGAPVQRRPFHPVVHAVLLGPDKPLYLSAHITGGHGSESRISETPGDGPVTKIAAKYLAPYLESREVVAGMLV
jgi:sulfide:quinone oxidoreductase